MGGVNVVPVTATWFNVAGTTLEKSVMVGLGVMVTVALAVGVASGC